MQTVAAIVTRLLPILLALPGQIDKIAGGIAALITSAERVPVLTTLLPASVMALADKVKAACLLIQTTDVEVLKLLPHSAAALAQLDVSDLVTIETTGQVVNDPAAAPKTDAPPA